MTIITETYIPYEYDSKFDTLKYVESRCHKIKKSLRKIELNIYEESGHLCVRCPLSGDYLDITGSREDIIWLDNELTKRNWYRTD